MSEPRKSWRDHLAVHPACELFSPLPPHELRALGEDIKKNGLQQRIDVLEKPDIRPHNQQRRFADGTTDRFDYVVIAGRSRLDAMELVSADIEVFDKKGWLNDQLFRVVDHFETTSSYEEFDANSYVISENIRRRHLTEEQRRELLAKLIKTDPTKSDRQIAKQVGASPTTAGKVRNDLVAKGDVSKVDTRTDTRGRKQPVKKPKSVSIKPAPPPTPAQRVEKMIRLAAIADQKKHGKSSIERFMIEVVATADREELIVLANHPSQERHAPARVVCVQKKIEWKPAATPAKPIQERTPTKTIEHILEAIRLMSLADRQHLFDILKEKYDWVPAAA